MAVRSAQFSRDGEPALVHICLLEFLKARLKHMEPVLAGREWLAETFSVADLLMADVVRLVDRFDGLARTSRLS
jgi:glutathione S-transferase